MHHFTCIGRFCLCLLFVLGVTFSVSAEQKTRILLTYGGHGFEEKPFFAMFDAFEDIETTRAKLPEQADLLQPGLQDEYDVIVRYDMVRNFSPEQREQFTALLKEGIGLVSLHHNLGAHRDWDEYANIIGGKYVFRNETLEGTAYTPSTYSHDEDLRVTVVDETHPIMHGVQAFQIHDESYGGFFTSSNVHVLLKTEHPKNDPELAWTTNYGNSRVFFFMLGHDSKAWAEPNYPRILRQGILWAAGR